MIDWRGNNYDIGSTVVFPSQSGRSVTMVEGVVEKITPATKLDYHCGTPDCYREHRVPVPGEYIVHVRRIRGARWEVGGTQEKNWLPGIYKPQLSKIRNIENITVVT